jgi:hypothetical protein
MNIYLYILSVILIISMICQVTCILHPGVKLFGNSLINVLDSKDRED